MSNWWTIDEGSTSDSWMGHGVHTQIEVES